MGPSAPSQKIGAYHIAKEVRPMAAKRLSRAVLNRWYARLDEEGKARFYDRYAKIFRGAGVRLSAGEWTITFAGHRIKLPLRPSFSWLLYYSYY